VEEVCHQLMTSTRMNELTLKDEETSDLSSHDWPRRKGDIECGHTKVGTNRVEGEDKRSFTGEMSEEDDFGTFPDLSVTNEFSLFVSNAPLIEAR
jgi:hypothetical protein